MTTTTTMTTGVGTSGEFLCAYACGGKGRTHTHSGPLKHTYTHTQREKKSGTVYACMFVFVTIEMSVPFVKVRNTSSHPNGNSLEVNMLSRLHYYWTHQKLCACVRERASERLRQSTDTVLSP